MGNIPHHDVLHSHPVLPEGRERHLVCDHDGEGIPEHYHQGHKKAPEPMGTRAKSQGVFLPSFDQVGLAAASPGCGQGSSGQERARWLVSQLHCLRTLLEVGLRGSF